MIKRITTLVALVFASTTVSLAQNSVAQFTSENMAFFTLSIDGVRLAADASIMQEVTGLKEGAQYIVNIDYVSPEYTDIRTTMSLNANGGRGAGHYSFTIPAFFQNQLRLEGFVPMPQMGMNGGAMDQMSLNMTVGETSMNMSMGIGQTPTPAAPAPAPPAATPTPAPSAPVEVVDVEGYSGKIGCERPVAADRFERMMERIEDASFSDDKVNVAKQILRTNCLVIEQLLEIMEEVAFDEGQLELAKFAYDHIYDLENYYEIYGVFAFSSSSDELDEFLQGKY
jgi:hypothetical protein